MSLLLATVITGAANIVDAGGIASAEAFGAPAISATIAGGTVASAEAFGAPAISATIAGGTVASAEAFGAPVISASIIGGAIASSEAFGASAAISATIAGGTVASAEAFGAPVISASIIGGSIASAEAFGLPILFDPNAPWDIVGAGGIPSAEAFGQPGVSAFVEEAPRGGRVKPGRRRPVYVTPSLFLIPPDHRVAGAGGIVSQEAVGRPTITLLPTYRPRKLREQEWILRRAA